MICYFILMYDLDNNIRSYRNNNFDSAIEIFVWTNIERGIKDDFDFKIYRGGVCDLIL
jgi:hypothetical protein